MKSTPFLLILVALVGVSLSGCIGGDDEVEPTETTAVPKEAEDSKVSATTGSLVGKVSSDLFEPLGGTKVSLDNGAETTVSRSGAYTMNDIEPGDYVVFFSAIGYDSLARPTTIRAGEVTDLSVQLSPLASDDPWVDYREWKGKLGYAAAWQLEVPTQGCIVQDVVAPEPVGSVWTVKNCGGVRSGGSTNGEVAINATDDVKTVIAEIVWDPAGPLGEYLQMDLMCKDTPRSGSGGAVLDTGHPCYFATTSATSPIVHRVDEAHWLEHGYNFTGDWASRVFAQFGMLGTYDLVGMDAGVAYEQQFTIYSSVFHKTGAPDGYTGIPEQ